MGVALVLDEGQLADPPIGLAQTHAELLRQTYQPRRQRRLARFVGVHRPERILQKTPIDRPPQLHQRAFHVDDLIKPRAEQILLAGLPSLAWSHRKSPLHQRASEKNHGLRFEGILKIEFARKSPSNGQKPANSIT